jgi:regulator of protease activity HflC (stomatin/prohibitin superfamily)
MDQVKVVPSAIAFCCCGWFIFAIIALPLSFRSLDQGRYALELNWHTQEIGDDVVVEPGLYYTGIGNMFVTYPSTFQTMYFIRDTSSVDEDEEHPSIKKPPLRARSADGLEMYVSLSFQWQLNPTSLHPLYGILGGGSVEMSLYRDEFVRFARAAIVESCANFAAETFFRWRANITADMLDKVIKYFDRPDIGLDIKIQGLQLREVDLPAEFDEEIIRTQENMQEVQVALAEREEQKITMEKDLMVAEERVKQVVQESHGQAEKTRIENEAIVKQMLIYQEKQASANAEILSKFLHDPAPFARLFEMMEIRALNVHNDSRLLINL